MKAAVVGTRPAGLAAAFIGSSDLRIAATALARGLTVVTASERH